MSYLTSYNDVGPKINYMKRDERVVRIKEG